MKKELIKNDRRKKYKGIGRQRLIIVQNKIILQPDLNFLRYQQLSLSFDRSYANDASGAGDTISIN